LLAVSGLSAKSLVVAAHLVFLSANYAVLFWFLVWANLQGKYMTTELLKACSGNKQAQQQITYMHTVQA